MPYVKSNQVRGILAGMPGAAEYEKLVKDKLITLRASNSNRISKTEEILIGKATGRMSAQSIAHLVMVLFIIFGNISYFLDRKMRKKD